MNPHQRFHTPLYILFLLLLPVRIHTQPARIDTSQFINWMPLPETPAPLRPTYGFNDDEFSIGGYFLLNYDTASYARWWDVARDLGISIIEDRTAMSDSRYDPLFDRAIGRDMNGRWRERIIYAGNWFTQMGAAREVILYPFDSSQSYYWPCFFRTRHGVTARNPDPAMKDHKGQRMVEQVYDGDSVAPNQIVAERLVFGFDTSQQIRRYPGAWDDDSSEYSGDGFSMNNARDLSRDLGRPPRWLYILVSGHLFGAAAGGGTARDSDTLLVVELWNEYTKHQIFINSGGTRDTTSDTMSLLYKSLYITKNDLKPGTDRSYASYRQKLFAVDMIENTATGMGGPWNPANYSLLYNGGGDDYRNYLIRRFDLKVRWTGREKLALHSIALRDTLAQLLFGTDQASINYKRFILDSTDRVLSGPNGRDTTRRGKLIRFYTGDEPEPARYAGFNWFDSTIYRRYGGGDAMTRGIRAWHGRAHQNMGNVLLSSDNEICVETYPPHYIYFDWPVQFGLPAHIYAKPALREHNGGRFTSRLETTLPELVLDTNNRAISRDNVEIYSTFVQRLTLGTNNPGPAKYPFMLGRQPALLSSAAWASRRTGRRIIHWPGLFGSFALQWNKERQILDTLSTQHEPAEMRAEVNIGLCYGSRGVHYPIVGGLQFLQGGPMETERLNYVCDWGPHGPRIDDTTNYDEADSSVVIRHYPTFKPFAVIPHFYTGWKTNCDEMRWLNKKWLPGIGPELLKLRWRDGYSIHFTVPQTYMMDTNQPRSRPLPKSEIASRVETFDIHGRKDSAIATFVELGFFDTKPGTTRGAQNPKNDTTHLFVVNRRTFERPSDINPLTPRGRLMDSLAETRLIRIQLNLRYPDTTRHSYVRIREVAPDTTPLAHMAQWPRQPLDTVIYADSAFTLMLGPGRAALLRIRFLGPATPLQSGGPEQSKFEPQPTSGKAGKFALNLPQGSASCPKRTAQRIHQPPGLCLPSQQSISSGDRPIWRSAMRSEPSPRFLWPARASSAQARYSISGHD
jgi:hypothetical protein